MRNTVLRRHIRALRVRSKIEKHSSRPRLSIFKSGRHIYAQILDARSNNTIVSASTLDKNIKQEKKSNCNITMAEKVGQVISDKAINKGIHQVVFDKGSYMYHGVIKALADAARKNLEF